MNKVCKKELRVRILLLISVVMYSVGMWGAPVYDFTPTDGGLVVNLKRSDQILLSTWVDVNGNGVEDEGEEYFVCHYPGHTGGYFGYTNWDGNKGNFLKLVPQATDATEPASPSIWTIDDPVTFLYSGKNYTLDGIAYTMWSTNPDGDSYTLLTSSGNSYKYQGDLTREANNANICNAVFVVPTNRSTVTTFDPNRTLTTKGGRTDQDAQGRFNGEKGYGFLGLPYREVYWLDIPRGNAPVSYTNASVVGFNKTLSEITYSNGDGKAKPGQALYAFGNKDKHHATPRTIFRLYVLNDPLTSSCADSYFFAFDEQDYKQYNKNFNTTPATYTTPKKIYTIDRMVCMERLGDTKYYVSDYMKVPVPDNTYYYVGYQNKYCHTDRGDAFNSQFKQIDTLKIYYLGLPAPRGAYGQMIVDTTQTGKQNLGVEFQPGGYFLRTNTGRNIQLRPSDDYRTWTCEEMWHITEEYAALTIKATMFTGSEYDEHDPGADIPGWSEMVRGMDVPVVGGGSIIDCDGWARIHVDSKDPNGHLEFVPANPDRHIHYNNNGCAGDTIADQYPMHGETSVTIREPRLVKGFDFLGWTTNADGTGTLYSPGDVVTLPAGTTTLYAKAIYNGTIHVALSFKKDDGKRYFLTHPGTAAPRFSRARYIKDWTDAYQGMANADNVDNRYINTFKVLTHPSPCAECEPDEVVLDPRREMRYGAVDSLLFYENFAPEDEEYLGLYYTAPNTVLANNSWAGLFKSTGAGGRNGWPDYTVADVQNAKLSSTHYLHRVEGVITRAERSNHDAPWIKYNATDNQFDGDASEANATVFQISRVRVADEHYVVIPDTTTEWNDTITFGIHNDERIESPVWSKLIGKQLMAMMKLDDDTVYFHPNLNNIITEYQQLRLNANYRLEESFEYIRDARVESLGEAVLDIDKPHITDDRLEKNYFGRPVTSGLNTPVNVIYNGEYIDIIDTIRITLRTLGPVKIKEYYGRWKKGAPGLHIRPDGSRYRDIIVRTKTVHHGAVETKLVLTPEYPVYNFNPLANASKQLNFTLAKVLSRQLLDTDGNVLGEEVLDSEDVTSSLRLGPGACSFTSGTPSAYFNVSNDQTTTNHVVLITKGDNSQGANHDTLVINSNATVGGVSYPVTGRIPLMQMTLADAELIWSVVAGGERYFIMAGSGGLIFRQFENKSNVLYKKEDGRAQLVKGSKDAANSDTKYITPWEYTYVDQANQQLTLRTNAPVNMDFVINGSSLPDVASTGAATLTYECVNTFVNDNANFEEQVKLKYGLNKWLKFAVTDEVPSLTLTENAEEASVFSWTYLQREYNLLNNGTYPDHDELVFGYNSTADAAVKTRYKAYRIYSMLLNNTLTYCGREDENDIADLISAGNDWKTNYAINLISDSRFSAGASNLGISTNAGTLITTVTPSDDSPMNIQYGGKYVNIVDTLDVRISLQDGAPDYRFADKWSSFTSVDDAHLKIPLIRKTYHELPYDSLICAVENDEHSYAFPPEISTGVNDTHTFTLTTDHRIGTNILDVENRVVAYYTDTEDEHTDLMDFTDIDKAEIRLVEENGNTPDWCEISALGSNTITVRCKGNGIRSPRSATLYIAYTMEVNGRWRFINFRIQVNQLSRFQYAGNQNLVHSKGASGADLKDGVQQVHENKTILYYYNPHVNNPQSSDQRVELPIRERNFYGWWRWYSLQPGEEDTDIPAARWQTAPTNNGKWNFPFRIIGDSVWVDENDPSQGKKLVTQGRYTVFHVPSQDYNARKDPPSKAPALYPPQNKAVETYAVDLSVYYDNLPLSMKDINQVDMAKMDTMQNIIEPTLSLREIYELHPWTEMAERMEGYKSPEGATFPLAGERYLEDHVVMAPTGNRLLLKTEQRYNYDNVKKGEHSESLLGYYMRDDNWASMSSTPDAYGVTRKDTMIWCGGWDANCVWYTYNPKTQAYDTCAYTITEANDFLDVPAHGSLSAGQVADTIIYCLRARSQKTLSDKAGEDSTVAGDYWFNICRYTIIYHRPDKYGPKLETSGKAILSNDEIEQNFEILERLNFDYNEPGTSYTVYPHPLPWADASYGFAYPRTASLPDNRPHNKGGLTNLANMGEYNLINRIPSFGSYWHKMEQHGGAGKGYMIFCDGMSSAGQVAALRLDTTLCEGQKMYFSGFVGNPGNETGKTCPNFTFAVQGSLDGSTWEDITSYMTGNLAQSNKWYQIYFPIEMNKEYTNFRVRVYNMAANDDGNDFIIDDMCIFATKPPLKVYQANTACKNESDNDSLTHIVLRVDYQGFSEEVYSLGNEFYTVQDISKTNDTTFLKLEDGYDNEVTRPAIPPSTKDTIYGMINLPNRHYTPAEGNDSIFPNLQDLVNRFETTFDAHEDDSSIPVFRKGYVFEHLDDSIRPVFYVIHSAKMAADNKYIIHMAGAYNQLLSSQCALTSSLKVKNRMVLTLNGDEMPEKKVTGMCANTLYDVSLHVKGTLLLDSIAPKEVTGSCYNDWLLHGDTTKATSATTYGYDYEDIVRVMQILRASELNYIDDNPNQFAHSLAAVDRVAMKNVQNDLHIEITNDVHPYTILSHLVNSGFLTLYQENMTVVTPVDDSIKYTIFPIPGTGSEVMKDLNVEVCPTPVHIALKSSLGQGVPLIIGGLHRSEEESQYPIVVLADAQHANSEFAIPIDSLMMRPGTDAPKVALKQITLLETNDPEFHKGVDNILLVPDRSWYLGESATGDENTGYYRNGNDTLVVVSGSASNYQMREGYNYTFGIEMMTYTGESGWGGLGECPVGTVPFVVSVVPGYLRWDPLTSDNRWNNPDNWIGINSSNTALVHEDARFAPLSSTYVVIPPMTDGRPYPVLPDVIPYEDSIQQVGFQYNKCKSIRFLPGAALSQQQRLEYDSVIADLSMPNQKWALRTSPVEGLLSGDLYMSNADLSGETSPWAVGPFDANGRTYKTGNATFWLSLYSREVKQIRMTMEEDTAFTSAADWSAVTNAMNMHLKPGQGWAVYSRTNSGHANVRLPKNDDTYFYYDSYGNKVTDRYEPHLREERAKVKDPSNPDPSTVGKMAFYPGKAATSKDYTLTNETASTSFIFGNPTMGYIDILGFLADNAEDLKGEFRYIDAEGIWRPVTVSAISESDVITSLSRYLPPMHAIELKLKDEKPAATDLTVTLNTNRIVTAASQIDRAPAPKRLNGEAIQLPKGIMTVTAVNPASPRCTSRLLLGQGFNEAVLPGEDAVLTTVNIDNFSMTNAPATPFNIYALEGNSGLSIDLRDEIVNVPISFYNSDLPFEPNSYLWFTGVNNIDGDLVLYDALLDIERPILDGICLEIETPETSHIKRYYIRRPGYVPGQSGENPVATGFTNIDGENTTAVKFIKNGHVFILRDGHVYSIYGQKIR